MGDSCISEFDFSYALADPTVVPRPPPARPHVSLPDRCTVSLPPSYLSRSNVDGDAMDLESETEGGPNDEPAFGFPVPRTDEGAGRNMGVRRMGSSHPRSKGKREVSAANKRCKATHCVRLKAPTPAPAEVFQSITATPGLEGRSFEEMRLECYAIAAITTGQAPQPVPVAVKGDARDAVEVKAIAPAYAPCVVPPASGELGRDFAMSQDALSAEFTFVATVDVKA